MASERKRVVVNLIFDMANNEEDDCTCYAIESDTDKGGFQMRTIEGQAAFGLYDEIDLILDGKW